ncbi:flagellar hook-associated protein FlgK [Amnibacterium kyonggiense]
MSSFGGLNTAYSGLNAARLALEVTGQNVANANTEGYTRQRITQVPVTQSALATYATQNSVGDGVQVTGVARVNDSLVDARVNSTASSASYWSTAADAASAVETATGEPGTTGLSSVLNKFWAAWQTMANNVGSSTSASSGAASALIAQGALVASTVSAGYQSAASSWSDARSAAASQVSTINDAAAKIADLNTQIRSLTASGGNVNSLLDQRDAAVTTLAGLTGASTRDNADGTVDVVVGGNTLVSGVTSRAVELGGSPAFPPSTSDPVQLRWADTHTAVSLDGGEMAARMASLQPSDGTGTGGVYAEAAVAYDTVAQAVADQVNAITATGTSSTGATGTAAAPLNFFSYSSTGSPALTLAVVPTSAAGIATADGTKGNYDTSIADRVSQIGTSQGAPDTTWSGYVARIGSQSATAASRASSATTAATAATTAQTSVGGVDLDEETSNLVIYQHAYQASARVISTINDVLDTLINMGAQ